MRDKKVKLMLMLVCVIRCVCVCVRVCVRMCACVLSLDNYQVVCNSDL